MRPSFKLHKVKKGDNKKTASNEAPGDTYVDLTGSSHYFQNLSNKIINTNKEL